MAKRCKEIAFEARHGRNLVPVVFKACERPAAARTAARVARGKRIAKKACRVGKGKSFKQRQFKAC